MKYADSPYAITKSLDQALRHRRAAFVEETRTRKAVHLTLITPFGLARNQYADGIQSQVAMTNIIHRTA
ncbi:MAG: hypothetical protein LBI33_10000 [Propionibacteriaceae bacterium]|jgi:membrane protein required for beta-lactamase induction|nr:hypothetical protein [Propionibacteriaceae bacterium]